MKAIKRLKEYFYYLQMIKGCDFTEIEEFSVVKLDFIKRIHIIYRLSDESVDVYGKQMIEHEISNILLPKINNWLFKMGIYEYVTILKMKNIDSRHMVIVIGPKKSTSIVKSTLLTLTCIITAIIFLLSYLVF